MLLHKRLVMLAVLAATILWGGNALAGIAPGQPYVPGEVIMKLRPELTASQRTAFYGEMRGTRSVEFRGIKAELRRLNGMTVEQAVARFEHDPRVLYIGPNYIVHAYTTPNDPMYGDLWGMNNTGQAVPGGRAGTPGADISAPEAWSVYTGTHNSLVCIIDTGLNYNHPDLAANVWTNPGEIAGNGIDDDGNGYIDDIHGWDFVNNDNDPMDDNGHGSHCAGTIGGVGNNGVGVTGVNWNVSIMSAKFLDSGGSGTLANAVLAVEYATGFHPDVMSNSWGGGGFDQAMYDAIEAANAQGIFFVAAAGNSGDDNDVTPHYPSSYANSNIIAVMATDMDDRPVNEAGWWSTCYGATSVDIAAPGLFIWSTVLGTAYDNYSGTSMATPHVSGAMAMLRGRFPTITVAAGKSLLLNVGRDVLPSLSGKCISGARLNLLKLVGDPDTIAPGQITDLAASDIASNWIRLAWTATGDDGNTGTATSYDLRYSTSPIDGSNWASATPATGLPNPQIAGSAETYRLNGLVASTPYYFAIKALDEYGNTGPLSNLPTATTLGPPTISLSPTSMSASLTTGGTTDQILTVGNVGEGILDFTIPGAEYIMPSKARFAAQPQHEYIELAKGADDTRPGIAPTKASGGPDAFGHRWRDSDEPGGPAFNWIEISTLGTAIALSSDDQNLGPFPIGFSFPYYGNDFSDFHICSNGWVSFTDATTSYSNVALPAAGAPGNLLALYWDDLTFSAAGDAYYYYDGTRLIIEYQAVPSYGTGGPYTMQIQLYPSGVIEYHYLTMGAASAGATIGIQDATGDDGLTVAFDAAYVHDNMAVRFSAMPPWLSTSPSSGSVAAGASVDVTVTYNAAGLCGSHFDANLHVLSNDPVTPDDAVSVGLDLTGTPDIQLAPLSLDFGSVYMTASRTLNLIVANAGCADLYVSGLTIDNADFTSPVVLPDTLIAGGTLTVPVVFAPTTPGPITGTLTLTSNDPDSPSIDVPLAGVGLDFPNIAVVPTSLTTTLPTGGTDSQTLTVSNSGAGVLNFTIPEPEYLTAKAATRQGAAYVELAKDAVDPRKGNPVIRGSGGPDAFGYTWKDSDEAGGPAFNWIEINTLGTPVTMTDDSNLGPFPIGFTMPFYGSNFTTFRICSNGWVSFSSSSTSLSNSGLPATGAPFDLLALFWDDLNPTLGGNIYYYNDGTRLIVEYKDVSHYSAGGPYSMQIHLYPSGRIEYHYLSMVAPLDGATIGIQNSTGTDGLQVVYNAAYLHDNMAIRFQAMAPWLSVSPASGAVNPGQSAYVTVDFNAADLCGDTYLANIHVLSNDPDTPDFVVPATLNLTGVPSAEVSAASLDFESVYLTQSSTRSLTLSNVGCATLQVTGLATSNGVFAVVQTAPLSVPVGASVTLDLVYTPVAAIPSGGTLTITSNDPVQGTIHVTLAGVGLNSPTAGVAPASITQIVAQNTSATRTLTLTNTGAGSMVWTIPSPDVNSKAPSAKADDANGFIELGKGEKDPRTGGPVLEGSGGPDASGYRWIDSDSPGGPVFNWIEISETGTVAIVSGDDSNAGPFNIGFPFKFYDGQFSTFRVCSNGWMSFTSTATAYTNSGLPSATAPFDLLAPFWDDLNVTGTARVYYQVVGGNLVVEWRAVPPYTGTGYHTFEVIIYPNKKVVFQYLTLGTPTNSATVGIQNGTGTVGLQCAFNAAYLHNNMAIQFSSLPQWLSAAPASGTIPPHSSANVTVTLNANGVDLGNHGGTIRVQSNDIHTPEIAVSVTMVVQSPAGVEVSVAPVESYLSQSVPNPALEQAVIAFGLKSEGKADLRIYDVRGSLVRTLVSKELPAGLHQYKWDGRTDRGQDAPSGVYFYKLRTDTREFVRRMNLVK